MQTLPHAKEQRLAAVRALVVLTSLVTCVGLGCSVEENLPVDGVLLDHSDWRLAIEDEDPWADRLDPLAGSCAELAWRVEGTGDAALLEVETSECPGAAVSHSVEGLLRPGDTVSFILWHLPLVKPDVATARLGIALDGVPVWTMDVLLPAEATVYQSSFVVPADLSQPEFLTIHVDNHGSNSWRFYTFEYAR